MRPYSKEWKQKDLLPLHVIVWRLLWLIPVMLAVAVLTVVVFISYGPRTARDVARDFVFFGG